MLCTFWLADCLALIGRQADARAIFERLLSIRNDVGLLSEMYDPAQGRLLGNFPQAFSHVGLVNTATQFESGNVGTFLTTGPRLDGILPRVPRRTLPRATEVPATAYCLPLQCGRDPRSVQPCRCLIKN